MTRQKSEWRAEPSDVQWGWEWMSSRVRAAVAVASGLMVWIAVLFVEPYEVPFFLYGGLVLGTLTWVYLGKGRGGRYSWFYENPRLVIPVLFLCYFGVVWLTDALVAPVTRCIEAVR